MLEGKKVKLAFHAMVAIIVEIWLWIPSFLMSPFALQ
jgi:hypothetical protein